MSNKCQRSVKTPDLGRVKNSVPVGGLPERRIFKLKIHSGAAGENLLRGKYAPAPEAKFFKEKIRSGTAGDFLACPPPRSGKSGLSESAGMCLGSRFPAARYEPHGQLGNIRHRDVNRMQSSVRLYITFYIWRSAAIKLPNDTPPLKEV